MVGSNTRTYKIVRMDGVFIPYLNDEAIFGTCTDTLDEAKQWLGMMLSPDEIEKVVDHYNGNGPVFSKTVTPNPNVGQPISDARRKAIKDALAQIRGA